MVNGLLKNTSLNCATIKYELVFTESPTLDSLTLELKVRRDFLVGSLSKHDVDGSENFI